MRSVFMPEGKYLSVEHAGVEARTDNRAGARRSIHCQAAALHSQPD